MKRIFTLILVLGVCLHTIKAQVYNYSFSNTTGTYTAISGGTVTQTGGFGPNSTPVTVTIPAFKYYGFTYTTAKIYPNGWLQLGNNTSPNVISPLNGGPATVPYAYSPMAICPFAGNLAGNLAGTSEVRYQTVGSEFIVQWTALRQNGSGSGNTVSFQARLNTTNGVIKYQYNGAASAINLSGQIGIRRSVVAGDCRMVSAVYQNIGDWTAPVVHSNVTSADSGVALMATGTAGLRYPSNGQTFTFTPPADCTGSLNVASVTLNNIAGTGVVCKGQRIAIRAFNLPTSGGLQFRWESSVNTSFPYAFTPVSGTYVTNDTTYELTTDTLMRNRVFQLKITCLATGQTFTTNPISITVTNCDLKASYNGSAGYSSIAGTGTGISSWRNGANTDDNLSNNITLPFAFTLRGKTFSNIKVSTNGFVTFDDANDVSHNGAGTEFGNNPLYGFALSYASMTQVLAPFYTNLTTAANDNTVASLQSGIKYQTFNTAPNREFVVEWVNMKLAGAPNGQSINFQLRIFENQQNGFDYHYGNSVWHTGQGFNNNLTQTLMGLISNPNPALEATYYNPVADLVNRKFMLHTADSLAFSVNGYRPVSRGFKCNSKYSFFTPPTGQTAIPHIQVTPLYPRDNNFTPATALPLTASAGTCTFSTTCSSADRIYQNTLGTPTTAGACTSFDDGWFRFTPVSNSTAVNISVRSVGILDPIISIYRTNLTAVAGYSCINATGEGATETINIPAGTLTVGNDYYLRVNRASSNTAADGFSLCYDGTAALPINLLEFTGKLDANNAAQLLWKAEKASNFSHFEIEHSVDGSYWVKAGSVSYAATSNQYYFSHANIAKGNNYYRLKQVDKDGKFEYSRVLLLNNKAGNALNMVMQGNMVKEQVVFNLQTTTADVVAITIKSSNGQTMLQSKKLQIAAGSTACSYNTGNYAAGVYYIEVISQNGQRITARVVKQ